LEFLKVGRGLEVEDVAHGERRGAKIDAVSIALDPETQVPQLVVVLRYEGADSTPEPSVVDDEDDARMGAAVLSPAAQATMSSAPVSGEEPGDMLDMEDDEQEDDAAAAAMRSKADAFAVSVGKAMTSGGRTLGRFGIAAATRFAGMLRAGGEKARELASRREGEKRRSTAPAPSASVPPTTRRLRPQSGVKAPESGGSNKKKLVVAGGAAAALTLVIAGAMAMGGSSRKPPAAGAAAQPAAEAAAQPGAPAAAPMPNTAAPATPGMPQGNTAPASQTAMNQAMPGNAIPGAPSQPGQRGAVANVPLFGPTPMATLEPAPLGPAPDELGGGAPNGKPTQAREDEFSDADRDESFTETSSKSRDKNDKSDKADKADKAEIQPEDVKPFVEGKLHLPVIHKLRLDKPGAALQGTKQGNGFTIVIPNRKITDSGTAIVKRDDRIADVKITNSDTGAKIKFTFRGSKVPAYKVRLRHSSIEFFISAP
jgi:hypothetical protein